MEQFGTAVGAIALLFAIVLGGAEIMRRLGL